MGIGSELGLEHLGAFLHHLSDAVLKRRLLLGVPAVMGNIPRVQEDGHGIVQPLLGAGVPLPPRNPSAGLSLARREVQ